MTPIALALALSVNAALSGWTGCGLSTTARSSLISSRTPGSSTGGSGRGCSGSGA